MLVGELVVVGERAAMTRGARYASLQISFFSSSVPFLLLSVLLFFFYGFGFLGKWIRWLFAEGKQGFLGVTVGVDCGLEIPSLTIDSNDGSL